MTTVTVEGFRELDAALARLSKSAGKAAMRKAGIKALEPIAEAARALAPNDPATGGYDLAKSITVGTKLSKSQAKTHRRAVRDNKATVEVFAGAGPLPQAVYTEFGTSPFINGGRFAGSQNPGISPQPFLRPAWDSGKMQVLEDLKVALWEEIQKAIGRAERRAARAAAGG